MLRSHQLPLFIQKPLRLEGPGVLPVLRVMVHTPYVTPNLQIVVCTLDCNKKQEYLFCVLFECVWAHTGEMTSICHAGSKSLCNLSGVSHQESALHMSEGTNRLGYLRSADQKEATSHHKHQTCEGDRNM